MTTQTVDFTTGTVGQKLTKNTQLAAKLGTRLEHLGYDGTVYQAAYGFKNLSQFVAATNVSQNVGIPFEQLKLQMTGYAVDADGNVQRANLGSNGTVSMVDPEDVTTAAPTSSLGQSIQKLKSTANATVEAQNATTQADAEIASASR
jgi:hypothetical protein